MSDETLLAAIRADLARSSFQGEGHRKVQARLRILDGIRVARTRVLRVMRAHGLLSPHRGRQGHAQTHDGTIVTREPNLMWGTDGVRVFTVDDGWVWTFAAVEPWNAECVGWYVCKVGSRFAALEPIAQGLRRLYGSVDAEVARGLALRMAHGSQYLSDHFLNQIRHTATSSHHWRIIVLSSTGLATRRPVRIGTTRIVTRRVRATGPAVTLQRRVKSPAGLSRQSSSQRSGQAGLALLV